MSSEKNFAELVQFDTNNPDNIYKRWQRWSKRLDRLLDIKNVRDDKTKTNYLFFYGGDCLEDIYNDLADEEDNDDKYEDILRKLSNFFRKRSTKQSSFSDRESFDELPSKTNSTKNKEEDMITFELVIDEENEKVNDLIQKYNHNREKMRELENEKRELDELIKKTIGLKIRNVQTKSSSRLDSVEEQEYDMAGDEEEEAMRKEECIDMLCNSSRPRNGIRKHVDFSRKLDYRVPMPDDDDEDEEVVDEVDIVEEEEVENEYYRMPPSSHMSPPTRRIYQHVKKQYIPPLPPPPPLPLPTHHYHHRHPLNYRHSFNDCKRYKFERLHLKKKILD